jgi:hypothetical protein
VLAVRRLVSEPEEQEENADEDDLDADVIPECSRPSLRERPAAARAAAVGRGDEFVTVRAGDEGHTLRLLLVRGPLPALHLPAEERVAQPGQKDEADVRVEGEKPVGHTR